MNKKTLNIIVTILILIAIAGVSYFIITGKITQNQNIKISEDAAKWIGANSVVYVQTGCVHCKEQEDLFGDKWKYIYSIDCLKNAATMDACQLEGITATPTWVINGKQYLGVQSIATLENLTGYKGK